MGLLYVALDWATIVVHTLVVTVNSSDLSDCCNNDSCSNVVRLEKYCVRHQIPY